MSLLNGLDENVKGLRIVFFLEEKITGDIFSFVTNIKNVFGIIFPEDPQILHSDPNAPVEIPRVIFQKAEGASLIITGDKLEFRTGLKDGRRALEDARTLSTLLDISCKKSKKPVNRIGINIETYSNDNTDTALRQVVCFDDYKNSSEKSIFWVENHEYRGLALNVCSTIYFNSMNEINNQILIDVNTAIDSKLSKKEIDCDEAINLIIDVIGGRLKNAFNE